MQNKSKLNTILLVIIIFLLAVGLFYVISNNSKKEEENNLENNLPSENVKPTTVFDLRGSELEGEGIMLDRGQKVDIGNGQYIEDYKDFYAFGDKNINVEAKNFIRLYQSKNIRYFPGLLDCSENSPECLSKPYIEDINFKCPTDALECVEFLGLVRYNDSQNAKFLFERLVRQLSSIDWQRNDLFQS